MAIQSSILAWKIPWTEEPGGATVHGVLKSQTWLITYTHTPLSLFLLHWVWMAICLVKRKRLYCVYSSGSNHLAIWLSFYSYHSWVNLRTSNPRNWEFSNLKINNNTREKKNHPSPHHPKQLWLVSIIFQYLSTRIHVLSIVFTYYFVFVFFFSLKITFQAFKNFNFGKTITLISFRSCWKRHLLPQESQQIIPVSCQSPMTPFRKKWR